MLRTRILTALIGGPIVVLVLYLGGIPWLAGIAVVSALAWLEMDRLVGRPHLAPERLLGLAFILVALVEAYLTASGLLSADVLLPTLTLLLIVSLSLALFDLGERPIVGWSLTFGTALYLGILLSHFILLRERSNGFWWVFVAGGLTWVYDASAYFVGSALGKHKLWPRISPKKSWEGLIGASVITPIVGAAGRAVAARHHLVAGRGARRADRRGGSLRRFRRLALQAPGADQRRGQPAPRTWWVPGSAG